MLKLYPLGWPVTFWFSCRLFPGHPGLEKRAGFSLVEVVLAMSVVAVSLVSIMGLLSGSMANFQDSLRKSTLNTIHDQIAHDLEQATWTQKGSTYELDLQSNQQGSTSEVLYFDADGNLLPNATGAPPPLYEADVSENSNSLTPSSSTASYAFDSPSGTGPAFSDSAQTPSMALVTTLIYRYPKAAANPVPLGWYSDYIARY